MKCTAGLIALALLALNGCGQTNWDSWLDLDGTSGSSAEAGSGQGGQNEANADAGGDATAAALPGPPPRKPLIGINVMGSKADHEGFQQVKSPAKLTEDNLIGMEPVDAMGLLGVPEQIREDPPAQVWAYRRGGCSLEIYFYLDLESDNLRSLTFELNAGEPSEAARQACFSRLLTPEGNHG